MHVSRDRGDGGEVAVEYGFLVVMIAVAVAIGALVLGLAVSGVFETSGEKIDQAELPDMPAAPEGT